VSDVRWEKTLYIEARTSDQDHQVETLQFTRGEEEDDLLVMRTRTTTYFFSRATIEAIYDLHNEVPR
jgi:hypothetical protein